MSMNKKERTPLMFDTLASRYDVVNAVLSFGMHGLWRRKMLLGLPHASGLKVLDLATGTADVAIALAAVENVESVVGVDLSEGMLEHGRRKLKKRGYETKVRLKKEDALRLDETDGSFDVVTCAFGLRNMPHLAKALTEAYRVLRPQGRLVVMEFSRPKNVMIKPFYQFYLRFLLPGIGAILTGRFKAYSYLSKSIGLFPYGERFEQILQQTGFSSLYRHEMVLGAVTIYVAERDG